MELIIGIVIGLLCGVFMARKKPIGNLRVDHSDGQPYLFLELDTDVGQIMRKKSVSLRVKVEDFLPHE